MRLSKHRRKTVAAMDMTPMIDITFQLMIFFMTCTQISHVNKEREVELPELKPKGTTEQKENVTLIINVNQAGEIKISGRTFTVPELVAAIGEELVKVESEPTRIHVVLRADRRRIEDRAANDQHDRHGLFAAHLLYGNFELHSH
jgi:biopolymer transport protein ExbD